MKASVSKKPYKSAFELQKKTKCTISVIGVDDWKSCFTDTVTFDDPFWILKCGGKTVPELKYLEVEAALNEQSLERSVVNRLINLGYILEELEVSFSNSSERQWGRCTWYKEHPKYQEPIESPFIDDVSKVPANFWHAMFKTKYDGDQHFCLFSMQMIGAALVGQGSGILLHKSMVYHRVVFSKPKVAAAA